MMNRNPPILPPAVCLPGRTVEGPRSLCSACHRNILVGNVEECVWYRYEDVMIDYAAELLLAGKAPKQIRFNLYKLFTRLSQGTLGWRNRIPPPACVEDRIKDAFPNTDPVEGDYTCFRPAPGISEDMM